jgi:hypothetical protein
VIVLTPIRWAQIGPAGHRVGGLISLTNEVHGLKPGDILGQVEPEALRFLHLCQVTGQNLGGGVDGSYEL